MSKEKALQLLAELRTIMKDLNLMDKTALYTFGECGPIESDTEEVLDALEYLIWNGEAKY